MTKHYYLAQLKSKGVAYVLWFFGFHFAYLNQWGLFILFWLTLGGLGLWWLVEFFMVSGRVDTYNSHLYSQIEAIEKAEKAEDHQRHLESIAALKNRD